MPPTQLFLLSGWQDLYLITTIVEVSTEFPAPSATMVIITRRDPATTSRRVLQYVSLILFFFYIVLLLTRSISASLRVPWEHWTITKAPDGNRPCLDIDNYDNSLTESISNNERLYDLNYWRYQESMNKFGAAYKGDILRFIIASLPEKAESVLEFGCSGGYIVNSLPIPNKYGVEINPASRQYAKDSFPNISEVYFRVEDIPAGLKFDVIYTTSVLEHVDCPLCELRKLKPKLKPAGIMIVAVKNDGIDPSQTFESKPADPNHHIYTWNSLLLANLLDSAGYHVCHVNSQFDAWHTINVDAYLKDKYLYCMTGLNHGKMLNTQNLWSISVSSNATSCNGYVEALNQIQQCRYLLESKEI